MSDTPTVFEGVEPNGATRREMPSDGIGTATRREVAATGQTRRTRRLNLPDVVAAQYDYDHDLPALGGEADVALLRHRASGEPAIFKYYKAGMGPDPMAVFLLRQADPQHIVRLIDYHDDQDGTWEIQEYCPLGSLNDWVRQHGGKLDADTLEAAVREVTRALEYLHGLGSGIAHRDLKPANVLVRAEGPLDLVLTDFGLARAQQALTHLTTTIKGTWHYAAPEVHSRQSSAKSDWFALGAMVFEFYTGRKLLAMADGTDVTEDDARARIIARNYSTDQINDPHWKLLADGLLTWDKDHRWGATEVNAWLRGESPRVSDTALTSNQPTTGRTLGYRPAWSPTLIATPRELADQFRRHWDAAATELAGRPDQKMTRFLEGFPGTEHAVRIINSSDAPGPKLVQLQGILQPDGPIHYDGVPLDDASITERIQAADSGDKQAIDWLRAVAREHILTAYAEITGSQTAAQADWLLDEWSKQAGTITATLPTGYQRVADEATRDSLPTLFAEALQWTGSIEDNATSSITVDARRFSSSAIGPVPWARNLEHAVSESSDWDLGVMVVARAVQVATDVERERLLKWCAGAAQALTILKQAEDFLSDTGHAWQVIDINEHGQRALAVTKDLIEWMPYDTQPRIAYPFNPVTWHRAELCSWLEGPFSKGLPDHIQARVSRVFLMSAEEVQTHLKDQHSRIATYQGRAASWWLRTDLSYSGVDCVLEDGRVDVRSSRHFPTLPSPRGADLGQGTTASVRGYLEHLQFREEEQQQQREQEQQLSEPRGIRPAVWLDLEGGAAALSVSSQAYREELRRRKEAKAEARRKRIEAKAEAERERIEAERKRKEAEIRKWQQEAVRRWGVGAENRWEEAEQRTRGEEHARREAEEARRAREEERQRLEEQRAREEEHKRREAERRRQEEQRRQLQEQERKRQEAERQRRAERQAEDRRRQQEAIDQIQQELDRLVVLGAQIERRLFGRSKLEQQYQSAEDGILSKQREVRDATLLREGYCFLGEVKKLTNYGSFVSLAAGKDGLLPVRWDVQVGQRIPVRIVEVRPSKPLSVALLGVRVRAK